MTVSVADRVQYAYNAGFRNSQSVEALSIIVAVSMCECPLGSACETGCNPDCCGCGCNSGCQSCGLLQVFQPCHPGTESCAIEPSCAFTLGYSISNGGTNFSPWSTFNNRCYQSNLNTVRTTINSLSLGTPPDPCANVSCGPGGICSDGTCYYTVQDPCAGVSCDPGCSCVNGGCYCPASGELPTGRSTPPAKAPTPVLWGALAILAGAGILVGRQLT